MNFSSPKKIPLCFQMPGVKIGDGAIVAARSVVVKDIEPYSIVGGNPAVVLRKRFDDELIELLLRVQWWDMDSDSIPKILPLEFQIKTAQKVKHFFCLSFRTRLLSYF